MSPFASLLMGRFIGALGIQIFLLSGMYRVFKNTGSYLLTGATGLALFLPTLGLVLFAGHWADRLEKLGRWYTILQAGFCGVTLLMLMPQPPAYFIFGILFLASTLRTLRSPLLYSLLKLHSNHRSDVSMARWMTISWQLPLVLGPALFSFLQSFGGNTLLASAAFGLMFTALLFSLRSVNDTRPEVATLSAPHDLQRQIASSNQDARTASRKTWLRASIADLVIMCMLSFTSLLPFLLTLQKEDPSHLGYLRAALSAGSLICASLVASSSIRIKDPKVFATALCAAAVVTGLISVTTNFGGLLSLCFAFGFLDGFSILHREAMQLAACHLGNAGQTAALSQIFNSASEDFGEFRAGLMAEALGAVRCLQVAAVIGLGLALSFRLAVSEDQASANPVTT